MASGPKEYHFTVESEDEVVGQECCKTRCNLRVRKLDMLAVHADSGPFAAYTVDTVITHTPRGHPEPWVMAGYGLREV